MFLCPSNIDAQGIFEARDTASASFTTAQETQYHSFDTNSVYEDVQLVEVGDIESAQDTGELPLILPFRSDTLIAHARNVQSYEDSSDYYWYGKIFKDSIPSGSATFMTREGRTFGQINYGTNSYHLKTLGDSLNVLIEDDPLAYGQNKCPVSDTSTSETTDTIEVRHDDCNNTVRVLVLYTDFADEVGNPHDDARLFIQQTNQTRRNSDLLGHVRFELTGVEHLDNFTENIFEVKGDLNKFKNIQNQPGSLSEQHQADLAVLLTDGNYLNGKFTVWGISYPEEAGLEEGDYGYALVEIDAGGREFTFAHEIGHLFGGQHENVTTPENPNISSYANGHIFDCSVGFISVDIATAITSSAADGITGMIYSNPDIQPEEYCDPAGRDDRNNARQIHDLACTVADYRDYDAPMSVFISGPRFGNNSETYEWCAEVSHCDDVASYEWEYSYDGFEYYPFGSTQCVTGYLPLDYNLHLRLTVSCANGETDVAWFMTLNTSKLGFFTKQQSESLSKNVPDLNIYPNPINTTLHGAIKHQGGIKSNEVQIKIINVIGENVDQFSVPLQDHGESIFTRSVGDLPPGLYQVILPTGEQIISESFIITK